MKSKSKFLAILKENGVMKAAELAPFVSTRAQLRRLAEAGEILSLDSGFYADPGLDPFDASLIAVARYYPKAVISNITALVIHELSDERIDQIDVDIPRSSSIRNKLMTAHRVSKEHIVGVVTKKIQGYPIKIYSPERSLCDAYKFDGQGHLFFKALKRYVKRKPNPDAVRKFDQILRTEVLKSLIQEMADG